MATGLRKTGMAPASGMPLLCLLMFIGWYGGARPSLLAMALFLLAFHHHFVKPIHSLIVEARQIPRLLFFLLAFVSLGIVAQTAVETPRTIRVVVDNAYAPYSFQSDESKLQGILIDQCRRHNRVIHRSYASNGGGNWQPPRTLLRMASSGLSEPEQCPSSTRKR